YLASIGGNSPRNAVYLLRVPEPTVSSDAAPGNHPVANTVRIDFKYPGSESYDAETLLVDPRQGDVYIVTKQGASGTAKVFFAAAPFNDAQPRTLELVHTIQFPTGGNNNVGATTGGDMSPDGAEAVIRTYDVIWLWHRADGVTWADAFKTEPCIVDTGILTKGVEPQGEAIAFAANGKDLRITTELGWNASAKEPILAYPRQ
ncbi:MAG: hypothetical protein KC417_12980, partial [Myxococcales bacterium]|nr:hypothetical protein [Myxococcales bacterium]